ncbi:MAG: cyclomaltodextrinase N-terminal domain-containing protein, partial [Bacteroidales bacterium]|nr:cyclomaltodextrinase N-terminal domain-containing protein [Bacteroidales bacterium]
MKTITLLFSFMIAASLYAQTDEISVDRIEPPFWWTGMTNSSLQLLIYGNDIGSAVPEISYPGVKVVSVTPAENPNFLFIDLELGKNVSSGIFAIDFKKGG